MFLIEIFAKSNCNLWFYVEALAIDPIEFHFFLLNIFTNLQALRFTILQTKPGMKAMFCVA